MKRVLNILLFLPMPFISIIYGGWFSVPGDGDTIPAASVMIGLLLVAVPMLILGILNVILFIVSIKCNNKPGEAACAIIGMITPIISFLWLFIISSFTVYRVTGIYAFLALIFGIVLLRINSRKRE